MFYRAAPSCCEATRSGKPQVNSSLIHRQLYLGFLFLLRVSFGSKYSEGGVKFQAREQRKPNGVACGGV